MIIQLLNWEGLNNCSAQNFKNNLNIFKISCHRCDLRQARQIEIFFIAISSRLWFATILVKIPLILRQLKNTEPRKYYFHYYLWKWVNLRAPPHRSAWLRDWVPPWGASYSLINISKCIFNKIFRVIILTNLS